MDDLTIIELYFDRSEQAIDETDKKYGKLRRSLAGSILSSDEDAEKCVSDAYLSVWNTIPPTLSSAIHFPKARSKACCTTPETACRHRTA